MLPVAKNYLSKLGLLLCIGLPNFLDTAPDSDFSIGLPYLGRSLFGALFLVFGLTLGVSERLLQRYWPRPSLSKEEAEKVVSEAEP